MATTNNLSEATTASGGDLLPLWSTANGGNRKISLTNLASVLSALFTTLTASSYVKVSPVTVANLPSASTAGAGARAFVTDASATTFAATVSGGGSNNVPVYSDGTNWKIG